MPEHINTQNRENKEKWLRQRGWTSVRKTENSPAMWRDPDNGVLYFFDTAFKVALDGCRLPADYELRPE